MKPKRLVISREIINSSQGPLCCRSLPQEEHRRSTKPTAARQSCTEVRYKQDEKHHGTFEKLCLSLNLNNKYT